MLLFHIGFPCLITVKQGLGCALTSGCLTVVWWYFIGESFARLVDGASGDDILGCHAPSWRNRRRTIPLGLCLSLLGLLLLSHGVVVIVHSLCHVSVCFRAFGHSCVCFVSILAMVLLHSVTWVAHSGRCFAVVVHLLGWMLCRFRVSLDGCFAAFGLLEDALLLVLR